LGVTLLSGNALAQQAADTEGVRTGTPGMPAAA
jgi:hypothetical protein